MLDDPFDRKALLAFDTSDVLDDDEERARLAGLLAVLRLPPFHDGTPRQVEVESEPGVWNRVDRCEQVGVDGRVRYVCSFGSNGHRWERAFERPPRWRCDAHRSLTSRLEDTP